MSVVLGLAKITSRCETRDGVGLAPPGLAHLLALALATKKEGRAAPDSGGIQDADPTHGLGEPVAGSEEIAGRTGQVGIWGLL